MGKRKRKSKSRGREKKGKRVRVKEMVKKGRGKAIKTKLLTFHHSATIRRRKERRAKVKNINLCSTRDIRDTRDIIV